eukprot:TRINITY_DN21136_c0_g1_i1.p1 TRINITY_DN21136_c0_g1~~TRINITY_DN21136_c0_g1_i1.p1  ORF type:complete len:172 (+),score=66.72 TRINITY_DN21136_c0_g1_i1:64-579(+)
MKSFMMLALFAAGATADIEFSRTVTQLIPGASGNVTLNTGCKSKDIYGSNDCTLEWGSNYTVTVDAVVPVAITTGATVEVDMKIDGIVNFQANCPLCGANCSFEVPVTHQKINQAMPPCPLLPAGTYKNTTVLSLPSPSPVPTKVSFKGTVTVKDGSGKELIGLSIQGSAS